MDSDVDSPLISADCTGPSQDPDWHLARVEQSALALVLAEDSPLLCRALGGPMGAVVVSVDCPPQLGLSITLQGLSIFFLDGAICLSAGHLT